MLYLITSWWWLGDMGVAEVLPTGFVRIVLLFTATSHAFDLNLYSLRFTASGVEFMDFHGSLCCFLLVDNLCSFLKQLYSLSYLKSQSITSIVSDSGGCISCYSHVFQSSSSFVICLNLIWSFRIWKKALTISFKGKPFFRHR